jgi:transcriptional regulator with XRE-family HTH domain
VVIIQYLERIKKMNLGDRIKQLRKEKKWGQKELAHKIGSDARQISRYEKGHVTPSIEAAMKIATALEVTTDYLFTGTAPRNIPKTEDSELLKRIQNITDLTEADRSSLFHIIDALLAKNKVKDFAKNLC